MELSIVSPIILYGVMGFLITWFGVPLICRQSVGSHAGERRLFHQTHKTPVARFGGVALVAAFIAVVLTTKLVPGEHALKHGEWVIILGALAMFGVGLVDDFRPLGAKIKLTAQILVATLVYFSGAEIQNFTNPLTHSSLPFGAWSFLATVFWLVAMTNLINLIDGIDGLAGGIAFMLMCLLVYVGLGNPNFSFRVAVGMAGALLAFIYFNFPPAKIYMGDGGAYFLGFLIGILAIENSQKGTIAAALIAPVFALALPIADVALAIVRRGLKGLPIFRPDRKHIHHKLVAAGFSHRRAVLTLYALSLVFSLMAFGVFWSQGRLVPILFGFMFLTLVVSARSVGFLQDWFAVGRALGTTLQLRKETRYALCLARWLELEAERGSSERELWDGFLFLAWKLGFAEVRLVLTNGQIVWTGEKNPGAPEIWRHQQELRVGNVTAIEFVAESSAMSKKVFDHLVELAAEAWLKAAQRWQSVSGHSIQLDSETVSSEGQPWERGKRFALPV